MFQIIKPFKLAYLIYLSCVCFPTTTSALNESEGKFLGGAETEYPDWFKNSFLDLSEDVEEATKSKKRLMIIFYQDGCPYCNALIERNFSQKDILDKTRKNFDVVAINLWGDRDLIDVDGSEYTEKTFAEMKKIQFTPTVFFYDENKNIILRINGYHKPKRFSLELDYVAQHLESQISYRDYMVKKVRLAKQNYSLNDVHFNDNGLIKSAVVNSTQHNFSKSRRNNERPFAVLFEQKDCPACINLHTKVLRDSSLQKVISKFSIEQLNIWSNEPIIVPDGTESRIRDWAKKLDIKYAPTIVLFNTDGKEIIRSEALFKVFHTRGMFEYVKTGAYKDEHNFQRFLTSFADKIREQGVDVNLWSDANSH